MSKNSHAIALLVIHPATQFDLPSNSQVAVNDPRCAEWDIMGHNVKRCSYSYISVSD